MTVTLILQHQALPIAARREVTHPDDPTPKPAPQIHVNPDPAVRGNITGQHDEFNAGGCWFAGHAGPCPPPPHVQTAWDAGDPPDGNRVGWGRPRDPPGIRSKTSSSSSANGWTGRFADGIGFPSMSSNGMDNLSWILRPASESDSTQVGEGDALVFSLHSPPPARRAARERERLRVSLLDDISSTHNGRVLGG